MPFPLKQKLTPCSSRWFDVRKDSEALAHNYGIKLGNARDIQLNENAVRYGSRIHLRGLDATVRAYGAGMWTQAKLTSWLDTKREGRELFEKHPLGWKLLEQPVMEEKVKKYIAGDTMCLFDLDKLFQRMLGEYSAKSFPLGQRINCLTLLVGIAWGEWRLAWKNVVVGSRRICHSQ